MSDLRPIDTPPATRRTDRVGGVPLALAGAASPADIGGKAHVLGRCIELGYEVPAGIVLPVGAEPDDEFLAAANALGEVVAVRSSGVAEDLDEASFAGQYETVLGIDPSDAVALRAAIAAVHESASSGLARTYAAGGAADLGGMAVVVQAQVDARTAGVAFSADPVTGDEVAIVSAVTGLGDRLVGGAVTPQDWRATPGSPPRAVGAAPESVLSDHEAQEVVDLVRRVSHDLGGPVDIEWARSEDGTLHLLQARPITALPRRPDIEFPTEGTWEKDTSHLCEPLTPIAETLWAPPLEAAFAHVAATYGLLIDGMEFRCFGGELYSHAIPPGGKEGAAPPWWVMGLVSRVVPLFRRKVRAARSAVESGLPERTIDRWYDEWRPELAARIGTLRSVELDSLDEAALAAHLDDLERLMGDAHRIHFLLFIPYLMAVRPYVELAESTLGWSTSESLALLDGLSDASSAPTQDLREVAATAMAHDGAARVLRSWSGAPLESLLRELRGIGADATAGAIEGHFARFGCRVTAFDPGRPTLDERPGLILGVLRDLVVEGGDPAALARRLAERRTAAEAAMEARLDERAVDPEARERLRGALDSARRVWPVREDNLTYTDALPSGLVRRAMLEIGRRLVAESILRRPDDACWLELDEVRALLAGRQLAGDESPSARVARRRAERAWVQAHPGPDTLGAPPEDPPDLRAMPAPVRATTGAVLWAIEQEFSHAEASSADTLRGTPASPGTYTGPVRIVRSDRDFGSIEPGDVLVCPITTPAWSLNFGRIGALVTDAGGALSHAAIVAREHGIPAVVATGRATSTLRDGQTITVDGATGAVTIHEGARS